MFLSNIELLKHILEETSFVPDSTTGKSKEDIIMPRFFHEVRYEVLFTSEASNKVDPDFKSYYPHIAWRKMSGTRNRLLHNYFGIDWDNDKYSNHLCSLTGFDAHWRNPKFIFECLTEMLWR
jgi:uncharacterized protein with HEPN domain